MTRDSRLSRLTFDQIVDASFPELANRRAAQENDQEEEEEAVAPQPQQQQPQHGNVDQEVVQAAANDDQNMLPPQGEGESSGQNQNVGQLQRNSSPDGNEEVAPAANQGGESSGQNQNVVQHQGILDHSQQQEEGGGKSSMKMEEKGSSSSSSSISDGNLDGQEIETAGILDHSQQEEGGGKSSMKMEQKGSSSSSSSISDGNLDGQEIETTSNVESPQSQHEEVGQTSMISEKQRRSSDSDPLPGNLDPQRHQMQYMEQRPQQERNSEDESEKLLFNVDQKGNSSSAIDYGEFTAFLENFNSFFTPWSSNPNPYDDDAAAATKKTDSKSTAIKPPRMHFEPGSFFSSFDDIQREKEYMKSQSAQNINQQTVTGSSSSSYQHGNLGPPIQQSYQSMQEYFQMRRQRQSAQNVKRQGFSKEAQDEAVRYLLGVYQQPHMQSPPPPPPQQQPLQGEDPGDAIRENDSRIGTGTGSKPPKHYEPGSSSSHSDDLRKLD